MSLFGPRSGEQDGIVLRRGTWGQLRNHLVWGYPSFAVSIRDQSTVAGTNTTPASLTVENSWFYENGQDGTSHFESQVTTFDADAFLRDAARNNNFDVDPSINGSPFDLENPSFVPTSTSGLAGLGATPPAGDFFDTSANT